MWHFHLSILTRHHSDSRFQKWHLHASINRSQKKYIGCITFLHSRDQLILDLNRAHFVFLQWCLWSVVFMSCSGPFTASTRDASYGLAGIKTERKSGRIRTDTQLNCPCLIPKSFNWYNKSQTKGNVRPLQARCSFYQQVAFPPSPSSAPFPKADVKAMHIKALVSSAVPE